MFFLSFTEMDTYHTSVFGKLENKFTVTWKEKLNIKKNSEPFGHAVRLNNTYHKKL
jgi:hypothetical protein